MINPYHVNKANTVASLAQIFLETVNVQPIQKRSLPARHISPSCKRKKQILFLSTTLISRPALSRQEVCLSSGLGAAAHLGDVPQREGAEAKSL